jgi:hypothetical protein
MYRILFGMYGVAAVVYVPIPVVVSIKLYAILGQNTVHRTLCTLTSLFKWFKNEKHPFSNDSSIGYFYISPLWADVLFSE